MSNFFAADWDFSLLESLIQDRGEVVLHETGVACPTCRREDATASLNEEDANEATRIRKVNCQNCLGYGYIYRNPTKVKGLLTSVNPGNRLPLESGYAVPGDCVFSPSLEACPINIMDRITTCIPDVLNEGQLIQRGAAGLSYAAARPTTLSANEDRLWYNGTGGAVWCEDDTGNTYEAGSDYLIVDNKIVWPTGGRAPDVGQFYVLKYYYYPEWIVYYSPLKRVDLARNLAPRVGLRKKHVAFMNTQDVSTASDRLADNLGLTGRVKI